MTGHVELLCRIVYESHRGPMTDEQWVNHWRIVQDRPDLVPQSPRLPEWHVLRDVKAALDRLEEGGYVVVPLDATSEMLEEAHGTLDDCDAETACHNHIEQAWRAMLAARPTE